MPRLSTGECLWRPGRTPVYPCTVSIPGLCQHSPGLHRGTTGHNRGSAVALPGSVWAPVELRCHPGCGRCRPGCSQCCAGYSGPSRWLPVYSGSIKHFNSFPVEPQLSPVHPGRALVHPGSRTGAPPAS
ncbi:hypothetical protein DPMN_181073 [Dreissena polymorpha]|uniref:Uncharacterized protein n=1 Tax=Dreissena polymorpha TaxID=45954 RepID=A0A9D4I405_DREPO|nr:hypothetical protein DPMN_181073 [Dreissena polymorpha]